MSNLQVRQEKIQVKRKQTNFREFVRDICSWYPFMFYKNNGISSTIKSNDRIKVIDHKQYEITRNQLLSSSDILWSNLFDWLQDLFQTVWLPNIFHFTENENSEYANCVLWWKNVYLSFTTIKDIENILYSFSIKTWSRNCINSFMVRDQSENIFSSKCILSSYNIFYSKYIKDSNNIWFSSNLIWCYECISCDMLQNQSYCIENKVYDKETYFSMKKEIMRDKDNFDKRYELVDTHWENYSSENITRCNYVVDSNSIENGQYLSDIVQSHNAILVGWGGRGEYVYDCFLNTPPINHIYGGLSLWTWTEHIYCSMHITSSMNLYYCVFCGDCSFCLGCIGLRNRSYCILNKQYTKEERYTKVNEIFTQMEKDWQLWEFFPASMNPFYFNDTAAYLIDPSFTKEEVTKLWYLRRDEPIKVDIPEWAITVQSSELAQFESFDEQWNWKLDETVCKRVILDEHGDAYRIIPMELEFLQKHGLPLPRKHWLTRMKENFRIS